MRNRWISITLIALSIAVVCGLAIGCAVPPSTSTPSSTPISTVIQVTIQELNRAYMGNVLAADAKYKDKILRITGVVAVIQRNSDDTLSMALTSTQFSTDAVWFSFDKKYESELAQLTIGQSVTVQGRCLGDFFGVHLKDCVLVH